MPVLIITHSQDNESVSLVMNAIAAIGETAFRFNTDRFPTDSRLEIEYDAYSQRCRLTDDADYLDISKVTAVWYRRLAIGATIPETMEPQLRYASIQEARATIQGLIASIQGFHLDPVAHIRRASNKQLQLQVAQRLGLEIPRTLITNDPIAVKQFAQTCPQGMVTKMLSSFAIYDEQGKEQVVFTNPVTAEDLEYLDQLRWCPMTFQEQIPKALELRTTIVGQQIFTAAVNSQISPKAQHDWRRQGIAFLKAWQPYQLPLDVEAKLLQLMAYFNLNYGAIDLIFTPDNRYIFLEINPVGEFFWLERCPGLPISQAIAEILTR